MTAQTTKLLRTQGVTAPAGFRATGIAAGIKKKPGALDLALVFNEGPDYGAAAVFTRNQVKAAPVLWSQQVLTTGRLRAVLLNSGGANACTGSEGFQDTHATAEAESTGIQSAFHQPRVRLHFRARGDYYPITTEHAS